MDGAAKFTMAAPIFSEQLIVTFKELASQAQSAEDP